MDYITWTYITITIIGIIYGSYAGYKEAKKADPTTTFNTETFVFSILRALPGIIASAATFITFGLTIEAMITAFFAGVGSDVVLKRSWRSIQPTASASAASAKTSVANFVKRRLMFLQNRK